MGTGDLGLMFKTLFWFQKMVAKNLTSYYEKKDKFGVAVGTWAEQKAAGLAR